MLDSLHAARVLMGDSLGFHIIFVMFSLTLPILVAWFEWMGIRKRNKKYTDVAKFWSKIMTVVVITGVISGTVVALQMSLIWPGILKFGGQVIGLPFMFETYAFLIEAVFLALYMMTWGKVSAGMHWFFGVMVALGANASAFVITSVDAWMNNPTGFQYVNGKFEHIDVVGAMFSETSWVQFIHSMPAYYFAATTAVAALYAVKLLKVRRAARNSAVHKMDWEILRRLSLVAAVLLVVLYITADITGKYLAKNEPAKLAAVELVYKTGDHVPFIIGGLPAANDSIAGLYVKVPDMLSLLAGNNVSTVVQGIDSTPKEEQPPLWIHALFDIKLALIGVLTALLLLYGIVRWKRPRLLERRSALLITAVFGWVGIILVELGWMITEIGRQPWSVRGYVTTTQALTTHDVRLLGYIFPLAYVILFTLTIFAIRKIIRDNRVSSVAKGDK